jgi:hypothetical protein
LAGWPKASAAVELQSGRLQLRRPLDLVIPQSQGADHPGATADLFASKNSGAAPWPQRHHATLRNL